MESELITLPPQLPMIGGQMINQWLLLAALIGIGLVLLIIFTLPIMLITRGFDKSVTKVKNDEGFQKNVATLATNQKDQVKAYLKKSPPDPMPSHERPGWSVFSTSLLIALFMAFVGAAFSYEFQQGHNTLAYSLGFAATGFVAGISLLKQRMISAIDANEQEAIPGDVLWIVVTGMLLVVFGLGVMMWVRGGGI